MSLLLISYQPSSWLLALRTSSAAFFASPSLASKRSGLCSALPQREMLTCKRMPPLITKKKTHMPVMSASVPLSFSTVHNNCNPQVLLSYLCLCFFSAFSFGLALAFLSLRSAVYNMVMSTRLCDQCVANRVSRTQVWWYFGN